MKPLLPNRMPNLNISLLREVMADIVSLIVGDGEPTTDATIVEATEKENPITLKPKARGDVKVIVTDQKGSVEEISVKVNPYNLKLEK